jgi:hypothetical protein
MRTARTSAVVALHLILGLLVGACGSVASDAPEVGSSAPSATDEPNSGGVAPSAESHPPPTRAAGVRIVAGWDPYPVFADGFNPWFDGVAMSVTEWADRLLPARPAAKGASRVDVDVRTEFDPVYCFAFHRPVTGVRVDVPGAAGRAIERTLLEAAVVRSDRLDDYRSDDPAQDAEEQRWCADRFGGEAAGFHIVEVHGEVCDLPGGPPLVCATVGMLGYHLGAREFWSGETFVFDATTGERLTAPDLLAPYDPVLLDELFARIRAEVPVPHLTWVDFGLDLTPSPDEADILPTAEGLTWRWSPYSHLVGGIDMIVPWELLETVRAQCGILDRPPCA